MFILQNIKEFVENPMGKGSNAILNRQLLRDDLNRRYQKLVKDKKIDLVIYRDKDEYYFHFKIPSESQRNNTYDVVLHFTIDEDKDFKFDNYLNRYYLKFFSNCPSFVYTYAYAFNLYGLFIEGLSNRYEDIVLNQDPITRNPAEVISYEKSIYFACYHILQNQKYLNKMILNTISKSFDKNELSRNIRTTEQIQMEIKKEDNLLKAEKEKERKRLGQLKRNIGSSELMKATNNKSKVSASREPKGGKRIVPKPKITARTNNKKSGVNIIRPK